MTLLLAASLLAALAGYVVIQPILARRSAMLRDVTAGGVLDAEARKRVALTELKEIEYDYLGGKLDEADYRQARERLSREALAAIRAVEAAHADASAHDAAALAPAPAAPAAEAHTCGFANPAGSRFCSGCGAPLA